MKKTMILIMAVLLSLLVTVTFSTMGCKQETSEETAVEETDAGEGLAAPNPMSRPDTVQTKDPWGGEVSWYTDFFLTADEVEEVRSMNLTAAWEKPNEVEWTDANVAGGQYLFDALNIEVVALTTCNNDPTIQQKNMEDFLTLKPDAVHSQPHALEMAEAWYRPLIDEGIDLVFLSNVPDGLVWEDGDYIGVVTDDFIGMSQALAHNLASEIGEEGIVGYVNFAQVHWIVNTRDEAFKKTLEDNYPNIEIVESPFANVDEAPGNVSTLITKYPEIKAVYTPWGGIASSVIESFRAANRSDILSVTHDLNDIIALDMAQGGNTFEVGADYAWALGFTRALFQAYGALGKEIPTAYTVVGWAMANKDNLVEVYNLAYNKDPAPEVMDALEQ